MERNVNAFNQDARDNKGYRYSANAQLSSQLANRRLSDAALAIADFRGKKVMDVGCGDGTYTIELFDEGKAAFIHGIDPAREAIEIAGTKVGTRNISFSVENAYHVPFDDNSFDVAYLRGVLHHMDRPVDALREALRVAPTLVVIEPNGYNPALKLIEKMSSYHREHDEKSYAPFKLDAWIESHGGMVSRRVWAGFVPMFCPDWLARTLKTIEPAVELVPGVKHVACAVYVLTAERRT